MTTKLEKMAKELEASPDYKVLRRLRGLIPSLIRTPAQGDVKEHPGIYLDVETTGLDVEKDQIIELAMYPFDFTADGIITNIRVPIHFYHEPKKPITEEITKLTGITNEMVKGQFIDTAKVDEVVQASHLVLAHHAAFDRQMVERLSPSFEKVCWGCSMSQVPWAEYDITGRKLEYVLAGLGYFYKAHNAVSDCTAGLFAMQSTLPSGRTGLAHVLDASRLTTYHAWAVGAPFETKDVLKARDYQWNGGEDGRPKAWHKEITDQLEEEAWLRNTARCRMPRFDRVTAFERFSKRG